MNFPIQITMHLTYSTCYSMTTGYFHGILHVTYKHNVCDLSYMKHSLNVYILFLMF